MFAVVFFFCGFIFLKKTDYLFTSGNIFDHVKIQNSNPSIHYEEHGVQNLENNLNSPQKQASNEIIAANTHTGIQDAPTVSSSHSSDNVSTVVTLPVTETTQDFKKHDSTEINTTVHPVPEDAEDVKYSRSRFVLCTSYWEQQTNALINMWSFQKWANKSGKLKVIEPFAVDSVLEFPGTVLYKHQFTNALRFRDYFDLDHWTKETGKLGIEPLVTWEIFLKYTSRQVTVVLLTYSYMPGGVYAENDIERCHSCRAARDGFSHATSSLFNFLHFEVIRTVCFSFYGKQDAISMEKFNSYLMLSDSKATVWFGEWRGAEKGASRIQISDPSLLRTSGGIENVLSMVQSSPKIIADSRNYVKTVLNADFREYTAIHIRSARRYGEMVLRGRPPSAVMSYLTNCVGKLNNILDKSGSTSYFLATDIGQFGDRTAYKLNDNDSAKLLQQLLQVLYGNKTIDVYQKEFIQAANGVEDRGYLATMQKTITEHAKCVIVMGGFSTFQRSVILNYKNDDQFDCVTYLCYEDPI